MVKQESTVRNAVLQSVRFESGSAIRFTAHSVSVNLERKNAVRAATDIKR